MLNLVKKIIFCKHYSLKTAKAAFSPQYNLLQRRYQQPRFKSKMAYLLNMQKEGNLQEFYQNKNIGLLGQQQIFCLLSSSKISLDIKEKEKVELLKQIRWSYFRCFLVRELGWMSDVEQFVIVIGINEECIDMPLHQISFCLTILIQFNRNIRKQLNLTNLESRLMRQFSSNDPKIAYQLITIFGLLVELGVTVDKMIKPQTLIKWASSNLHFDVRVIYFIHTISNQLKITLPQALSKSFQQKLVMMSKLDCPDFDTDHLAFMLQKYPGHIHKIQFSKCSPQPYLNLLRYFQSHPQQIIKAHNFPKAVLVRSSNSVLKSIIQLRQTLGLDTPLSLATKSSQLMTLSLRTFNTVLVHFRESKIKDIQVQYYIQKAVISCFQLSKPFQIQLLQQYQIGQIMYMFTQIVANGYGSIQFWQLARRWIEEILDVHFQKGILGNDHDNYINLMDVVSAKSFGEKVKQSLYGQLRRIIGNKWHPWMLHQLARLSSVLAFNKIGQDQIWYQIDIRLFYRLKQSQQGKAFSKNQEISIGNIAKNFNRMNKGSERLWRQLNKTLSEQKKSQIMHINPNTRGQARVYFRSPRAVKI